MGNTSKIAQGSLTFSKAPLNYVEESPRYAISGQGCKLFTEKGSYIDYVCGLGSNLLDINNNYGLPTRLEETLAERLCDMFGYEKLKFYKTGSDACEAAVRIARESANTPLKLGEHCNGAGLGYHGKANNFIAFEEPAAGCVDEGYFKCRDLEEVIDRVKNNYFTDYCIIEPVQLCLDVKTSLRRIRDICTEKGIVLIFDEIITGFRVPKFSISNWYGIKPDLLLIGKGMANGYPLSAVLGSKELMEGDYFTSSTFNGESSALRECDGVLNFLTEENIDSLWRRGKDFLMRFNCMAPGSVEIEGYPTRGEFKGPLVPEFIQGMAERGFLFHSKCWFITHAHNQDILNRTLKVASEVLLLCESGEIKLKGERPGEVFKRNG